VGKKWGRTGAIYEAHMDDIARDFEGGAELREIAIRYGVSPPTITNWLIAAGYKHRRKGRYPQAMKDRAGDLYNRGWEPMAIANLLKTKLGYVYNWIGEDAPAGSTTIPVSPPMEPASRRHVTGRRWTEEQKDEVVRLLASGVFSVDQIYRLTNASRVRQQRIWKEALGIPFPLAKVRRPRRPVEAIDSAEAFQQGRLEGIREARQLALEAASEQLALEEGATPRQAIASGALAPSVTALDTLEASIEGASEDEIEAEFKRFEEQKRFLDER